MATRTLVTPRGASNSELPARECGRESSKLAIVPHQRVQCMDSNFHSELGVVRDPTCKAQRGAETRKLSIVDRRSGGEMEG